MFTKLRIQNFQSLGDVTLELGKITVIIGPSFLGKSAVVRAVRSLVRNRFEASFLKKGASATKVELYEGDKWVQFYRAASTEYLLSGYSEPFTKVGRDVPQKVAEFLNMPEILFDTDFSLDFNIQGQFDPPFIISLSNFETAKVFGKMMNLDIVVMSSRQISSDILALNKLRDQQQAITDVSIDYIQKHYSIELKYSLLQEALEVESNIEQEEDSLRQFLDLLVDYELCLITIKVLTEEASKFESFALDSMLEPPAMLEKVLVSLIQEEALIAACDEVLQGAPLESFDVSQIESLEAVIPDYVVAAQRTQILFALVHSIESFDFNLGEQIELLATVVANGTKLNESYIEDVKLARSLDSQITSTTSSFKEFIAANNICPISHQPYTQECIAAITKEVAQ